MKLILKHDDKEINYTKFAWIVLWSTQISRAKKFAEITIVAKDFDCWKSALHPLPCGSPHTSYRFIIKFIIVVSFCFNRFAKQTTNCKTLGEGTNIYKLNPCMSVRLSRSWKLSPQTRGPKNYSGPQVLTSVSAQQLPETDIVDAAISKLPLLSFCIYNFPITSQSPSFLCFLFVSTAFQSPRNLQASSAFFLYLQLSNHLAISKLPLLSFYICSFPITS